MCGSDTPVGVAFVGPTVALGASWAWLLIGCTGRVRGLVCGQVSVRDPGGRLIPMSPGASYRTSYFVHHEINKSGKDQEFTDWCQGWAKAGWRLEHITTVGWGPNGVMHTCIWVWARSVAGPP